MPFARCSSCALSRCTRTRLQGDGSAVTLEPGLIGGEVNRILAHHHKTQKTPQQFKIGPDPSSIDSCMIGGIVANNSSGAQLVRQAIQFCAHGMLHQCPCAALSVPMLQHGLAGLSNRNFCA